MKRIKELVEHIDEELCGAKQYAEMYVERKADGDTNWANRFHGMAEDELKHAEYIHEYAMMEINRIGTIFKAPEDMQKKWDEAHKCYVEKAAWIRLMLTM